MGWADVDVAEDEAAAPWWQDTYSQIMSNQKGAAAAPGVTAFM